MAYIGGGTCREVICSGGSLITFGKNDPDLGGKNWSCAPAGILKYGTTTLKAFVDPTCPNQKFTTGWGNTCKQYGGDKFLGIDQIRRNAHEK